MAGIEEALGEDRSLLLAGLALLRDDLKRDLKLLIECEGRIDKIECLKSNIIRIPLLAVEIASWSKDT